MAVLLSLTVLGSASSAYALTCPAPPADSPVAAPTLDTIPPGALTIITYTTARAEVTANGRMAVVEMNDNEQRVWFGPDADPGTGRVYYNRRYRADAMSPWYWRYNKSIEIMSLGATSAGPNSVLYSATPKYQDTDQNLYKYVMYLVSQPKSCDVVVAGILYAAYSNDGVCWTGLRQARRIGGPSFPCSEGYEVVPIETIAAIDGGSTIYFLHMEGDLGPLTQRSEMDRSAASISTATMQRPSRLTYLYEGLEVTPAGIVSPGSPAESTNTYAAYKYLMNLDMAYDPPTGNLYIARAYPFPFDRDAGNWNVPCRWQAEQISIWDPVRSVSSQVEGCKPAPFTLPNRVQIYKLHIGSLANIGYAYSTPWTLVADLGGDVGYTSSAVGACANNPYAPRTDARQQDAGRDYAYVNFVRDPAGNLKLHNGVPSILAGDSFMKSKGRGECYITGLERETLVTFPR